MHVPYGFSLRRAGTSLTVHTAPAGLPSWRHAHTALVIAADRRPAERAAFRFLAWLDAVANRLYGWRANPLYQSGTIVIACLLVLLVTGLWLILFYRVGALVQPRQPPSAPRVPLLPHK